MGGAEDTYSSALKKQAHSGGKVTTNMNVIAHSLSPLFKQRGHAHKLSIVIIDALSVNFIAYHMKPIFRGEVDDLQEG